MPIENLLLQTRLEPGIVKWTLNRPEAFNALSEDMLTALAEALQAIDSDRSTKVVILDALGKAFCAGHDLKEMRAEPSLQYYERLFARCSEIMLLIQRIPQTVIAQVQGVATAAGCQLVAMCDLAVSSKNAKFAVSGVNLGLFCATPSVALSRNIHRKQAMYLLLTGDFIDADQACEWGLVNEVVEPENLAQATLNLANKIAAKPLAALQAGKRLFYRQIESNIQQAYQLASQTMACNMMDDSALEGVQAFIEKRPPNW
jgi:enoyl-CoA hydratase/carnithine racemase